MSSYKKLGDIANFQKGFAFKSKDFQDKGYNIVKVTNLSDDSVDFNDCNSIDEEFAKNYLRYELFDEDIIITTVGSWPTNPSSVVGKVVHVPYMTVPSLLNQNTVRVRANENINQKFLYYSLKESRFKDYIVGTAQGSANQASITQRDIKNYDVYMPKLEEQTAIAKVLSSFDDKIKNNNAIIANIEEQAQVIFQNEFVKNELMKNQEYEIKKLGEFFSFVKGKKPKNISKEKQEGFVPYLVKKYIDKNEVTYSSNEDGILINYLDVFMLMDGANSGNIYYGYNGILGSTFSWLKNDNEMINEYIYWYLLVNQESVRKQNTGSAIPHANKDYLNDLEVVIPIDIDNNKILITLRKIRLYSINLRRECNKLTALRDTLLPKLMSGEIQAGKLLETK